MKILFYDVETTGTDYKKHSVVQLSGIIVIDWKIVERFNFKVRPHEKAQIDKEALIANGLTVEEIKGYPEMKVVCKQFTNLICKHIDKYDKDDKMFLAGFNNRGFDDFFIRMFLELCGDNYIGSYFWPNTLDVLCQATEYLMERRVFMPSFKLHRVATELGVLVDKSRLHDAVYDVELTLQIYLIVTGRSEEPAQNFNYYYHPESGSIFKTAEYDEGLLDSDPLLMELTFMEFKKTLKHLGMHDGAHLIHDELM